MMDDAELVRQLRAHKEEISVAGRGWWETPEVCMEAAARIEALIAERDEARAAWEIEAATVKRFAERHERHLVLGAEVRARAEKAEAERDAARDAPTFTAADLERAWEMGRDAVLADVQELRDLPSIPPGNERAEVYNEACDNILRFTARLTPPADLAQRVKKGPAHD